MTTRVPEGVEEIDEMAFKNRPNLREIGLILGVKLRIIDNSFFFALNIKNKSEKLMRFQKIILPL